MEKSNIIVTPDGVIETDHYIGKCSCGGTLNKKFRKGKYIIYFLPKKQTYHIKENGSYIEQNQPISALCPKLKSLGFPECVASSGLN